MNTHNQFSSAIKAATAAVVLAGAAGAAFAQGTPPTTSSPNPATGAGQQSPAGGPMGTTGVQPQAPGTPAPSSPAASTMPAPTTPSASTMPAQQPMTSSEPAMRTARADRN